MEFVAVRPPDGRPYIRTRAYGDPLPAGTAASLDRAEVLALAYFGATERFFEVLATRGRTWAERFADELHLRLAILNPVFRDVARHAADDDTLLDEALRDAEAFPEAVLRPEPLPDQIRVVLKDGHAVAYSTYGPEAREPGAADRPLLVQMPAVVWALLREEPQLEEEVLARAEAGGGLAVADVVEPFIARLYAEDRVDAPLAGRVYSSYGRRPDIGAEHLMAGEDDPLPVRWAERRRRSEARVRALEQRRLERRLAPRAAGELGSEP